ncbi:MAG: hypothetical protein RJB34_376 [Pseudomonadota bacterium]|jgi:hypothetical protein
MRQRIVWLGLGWLILVGLWSCGGGGGGGGGNLANSGGSPPDQFELTDYAPAPVNNPSCVPGEWTVNTRYTIAGKTVQYQTDHFALSWAGKDMTLAQAKTMGENLERIWSVYMGKVGWPEPYCDTADKKKVNVMLDPQYGLNGAGTGDRDPAFWVNTGSGSDTWGLAHEFAHSLQFHTRGLRDTSTGGWFWESHAQYMARQFHPEVLHCGEALVNSPHLYYGSTRNRYCNFQFWEFLKNKHGHGAVNNIWTTALQGNVPGRDIEEPLGVLMRSMELNTRQLGDLFGEWAMRNVAWDYQTPEGDDHSPAMRAAWGNDGDTDFSGGIYHHLRRQSRLLAQADGRYAIPNYWAPQRYGYNLVRLRPQAGASQVVVDFSGLVQSEALHTLDTRFNNQSSLIASPASDWRWGLVAIDGNDRPRYSPVQRGAKGSQGFALQANDKSLWLVVVATPTELHKAYWDQAYNTFYRYPWSIGLTGAWPDGHQPDAPTPTTCGAPHPNGGGWVDCASQVADTVFVGPNAVVLSGTLKDAARVEDHAIVRNAHLSGQARVGALSYLWDSTLSDQAYVANTLPGNLNQNLTISGTAMLWGDLEVWPKTITQGTYTGMVVEGDLTNPASGSQRRSLTLDLTLGGWSGPYLVEATVGQCLQADEHPEGFGTLRLGACTQASALQQWSVTDLYPGTPVVQQRGSALCVQTESNQLLIGTAMHLWPCDGTASGQQWRMVKSGSAHGLQSLNNPLMCAVNSNGSLRVGLCTDTTALQWVYRSN